MKHFAYLILLTIIALYTACSYDTAWQTPTFQTSDKTKQLALSMPSYMEAEPNNKLNPNAVLQYCNYYRNVYAIVLDESKNNSKDSSLQQYASRSFDHIVKTLLKPQLIDSTNININNLSGTSITLTGDLGQLKDLRERIYYRIAFVESKTHYYQIATWTWDSRRQNFANDLNNIIASFKEINQ